MERKEIFRTLKFLDCNHLQLIETESFFRLTRTSLNIPRMDLPSGMENKEEQRAQFPIISSTIVINNIVVYAHTEKSPHVQ